MTYPTIAQLGNAIRYADAPAAPLTLPSILAGFDTMEAKLADLTTKEDLAAAGLRIAELLESARNLYRCAANAERFAPEITEAVAAPAAEESEGPIEDATYTVVKNESEWYTIRIKTAGPDSKLAGKRIASFLSGPDNETAFTGFAFVTDEDTAAVWGRCRTEAPWIDSLNIILGYPTLGDDFRTAYAQKSGRCARCGRKLTVPASLNRGLGPECAKQI
jgi:hypothetical protein